MIRALEWPAYAYRDDDQLDPMRVPTVLSIEQAAAIGRPSYWQYAKGWQVPAAPLPLAPLPPYIEQLLALYGPGRVPVRR